MKGVLVRDWTTFDKLPLEEVPDPEPAGNGMVLRTQAAGVSFAASLVVQGKYQRKPPRPFVPGTEVAGIVETVGPGVTRFRPGDRVTAMADWGGMGEKTSVTEVNSYAIPDELPFAEAVTITNSYGTPAGALTWPHLLRVGAGDWLLVHGAAGGVGLGAVEIGKALGAQVIATAGSAEKLAAVKEHGADHVIDYRETGFRDAVLDITDGRGVDAVFDPVGGDVFLQSLRCMAPEARIMPVGFASGTIPQIPANLLLVKNLIVTGFNLGYYIGWSPRDVRHEYEDQMRALIDRILGWWQEGKVRPVVTPMPLERYREAMDMVLGRRSIGRVALVMNEEAERLGLK